MKELKNKQQGIYIIKAASGVMSVLICLMISAGCESFRPAEDDPVMTKVKPQYSIAGRPVVLIMADGCRKDQLYQMAEADELPNIKEHFFDRGAVFDNAVTSMSSTTQANVISILTGRFPGHTNVPGNAWFDHRELKKRSYNSMASMYQLNDDIAVPTIYEMLSPEFTVSITEYANRGASWINTQAMWFGYSYFIKRWRMLDRITLETFHDVMLESNRHMNFPTFSYAHLLCTDMIGHEFGPNSSEYRDALVHYDEQIGRLMRSFKENGLYDKLTFILTSDHGMASIGESKRLNLSQFIGKVLSMQCSNLTFADDMPLNEKVELLSTFQVLESTSGDRHSSLYFRKPLRQGHMAWRVRPSYDELRRYPTIGSYVDLIEVFRVLPAVDVACLVDDQGDVHIFSATGEAVVERTGSPGSRSYAYNILSGDDPLGYSRDPIASQLIGKKFHASKDWLEATCHTEHPDFVPQIMELFDSPRHGDIVLFAADGWTFDSHQRGAHGGASRVDMIIPLLIAGPGIKSVRVKTARNVDILPTILEHQRRGHLLREFPDLDGDSFYDMIRDENYIEADDMQLYEAVEQRGKTEGEME